MLQLENFARRLIALRENAGLTKSQFAREMGLTPSTIGNLEHARKRPGLDTVIQMADFFGVSVDYLLGRFAEPSETAGFPQRARQLRKARKLSQADLAAAVGTSGRNYNRYENGSQQPTLPVLLRLAEFFDVSLDYLIGFTENPHRR